jgi:hypothetical protein
MLLLFGLRVRQQSLVILTFVCDHCSNPASHRVIRCVRHFRLLFIPIGHGSTRYSIVCAHCSHATAISDEQAQQYLDFAAQPARVRRPVQLPAQPPPSAA